MQNEIDLTELYSMMRPKKVCLCMSVTEQEIIAAIKNGADSLDKIMDETNAGQNCGTCTGQVMMLLIREQNKKK